jgi:hypothetical protein
MPNSNAVDTGIQTNSQTHLLCIFQLGPHSTVTAIHALVLFKYTQVLKYASHAMRHSTILARRAFYDVSGR